LRWLSAKGIIVSITAAGISMRGCSRRCAAEISAAVGAKAEVYVDGSIRRGCASSGAGARRPRSADQPPAVWGHAIGGADGVQDVFAISGELVRTMALCGVANWAG
jgi:isopentenyl diphosphate isomerase/L-lactate dehydrogenase-like FMN-dependent dehydrogenase